MRKDPVTLHLREEVFDRDREAIRKALFGDDWDRWYASLTWTGDRLQLNEDVVCAAILVYRKQLGKCKGRWTIEHVKSEARLGVRAPSDLSHLVSLCEGHTENGMKAGHQWNTAHRPELREYLGRFA